MKTTRQKKKKKWKERGEWPATGMKTEQTSLKLVAELELAAKKAETRAVAAETEALCRAFRARQNPQSTATGSISHTRESNVGL